LETDSLIIVSVSEKWVMGVGGMSEMSVGSPTVVWARRAVVERCRWAEMGVYVEEVLLRGEVRADGQLGTL